MARAAPKPVPPVVHDGARYEAPHRLLQQARTVDEQIALCLWADRERALFARLDNPAADQLAYTRKTLEDAGFAKVDVDAAIGRMALLERFARAMEQHMPSPQAMRESMLADGAVPDLLNPAFLDVVMTADGSFTPEDREACKLEWKRQMTGPPVEPQSGGHVVAYDQASKQELWRLQVYRTAYDNALEGDVQDVFITSLTIEGDQLIVRDEKRWVHHIDLMRREVVDSFLDLTSTPLDLARQELRKVPAAQRQKLWARIRAVKRNLDALNIAATRKAMASRRDEQMKKLAQLQGPDAAEAKARLSLLVGGRADDSVADLHANLGRRLDESMRKLTSSRGGGTTEDHTVQLPRNLSLLLDELQALTPLHALVEVAYQAGLRHQQALAAGGDPHRVGDWYKGELSWIFIEVFDPKSPF